jgi:tight adherence protein B
MLAFASWLLFARHRRVGPSRPLNRQFSPDPGGMRRRLRKTADGGIGVPQLAHQLSALLRAGRSTQQLWADALLASRSVETVPVEGSRQSPSPAIDIFAAAERAAARGHSVSAAIRAEALRCQGQIGDEAVDQWRNLAACLDVAQASGAPLAEVLARFAHQLEADLDAFAVRQTALAGPRATVRILTWLPFLGLGLGLLMGVDPLSVLLGSPIGLTALASGVLLMVLGRWWSNKLVRIAAAGPRQL